MGYSTLSNDNDIKVCVIMVGLPARGKSFISQKIIRYLSWLSIKAKCFNVGNYRRDVSGNVPIDAEFFNFDNADGFKLRELAAQNAMKDILDWFAKENGSVAVFDATNSTRERRKWLKDVCRKKCHPTNVFGELVQ